MPLDVPRSQTVMWGSFVEQNRFVAPEHALLTSRAGRWATSQVGRLGRTVSEVAAELGGDGHTVNKEVMRWGEALLEADTSVFGVVEAVGVDETLFWRKGRWKTKQWCMSVVGVGGRQLSGHSAWQNSRKRRLLVLEPTRGVV